MRLNNLIESISISIKWSFAHFVKRFLVILLCILAIPMILMSVGFEIFAEFFHSVHKLLERVFSFMYDVNRPFVMALFKSMGFICGEIYLGNELNRAGVYKLKQVAKDNGIKCYVIDDMYRIENAYYIKVIVPRTTDLNLLKIIFAPINSNVKF